MVHLTFVLVTTLLLSLATGLAALVFNLSSHFVALVLVTVYSLVLVHLDANSLIILLFIFFSYMIVVIVNVIHFVAVAYYRGDPIDCTSFFDVLTYLMGLLVWFGLITLAYLKYN